MRRMLVGARLAAAAALTLVLTAGCGQKGALYLPKRGTVVTRPAASSAPADTDAAAPADSASPPGKPADKKDDDKPKPQG